MSKKKPDKVINEDTKLKIKAAEDLYDSLIQNAEGSAENTLMVKYSRKVSNEIFKEERMKLQAYLIAACKTKIKVAERMLINLEKVEKELFSDTKLKAAQFVELLATFEKIMDKYLLLSEDIKSVKDDLLDVAGSTQEKGFNINPPSPLNPNNRRKIQIAYNILLRAGIQMDDSVSTLPTTVEAEVVQD